MAARDIIVIGASAGGVDALRQVCERLPAHLPATVFVTQHLAPSARSAMPHLLSRAGPLPAVSPADGEATKPGRIYVAAPDLHMLVRPGRVLMRRGPTENRTRPAIDVLFRSAAIAYGSRVIGVVLTGLLDDGTEGLIAIKAAGGLSIVQDPAEAEWAAMPRNALKRDHVDHVAPLSEIGSLLARLCREEAGPTTPLPSSYASEDEIAAQDFAVMEPQIETPGAPSQLSCPDCGGVLNAIPAGGEVHYRCQVGHGFTALGLADAQAAELERALGVAVRTHRDRIRLFEQMSANAQGRNLPHAVQRWRHAISESRQMVEVLEAAMASLRKPQDEGYA